MSDHIGHECGIALVRLLKPLSYYQEKYGSPLWGFEKLFLLMEKQHNRGQDGTGIGCVKIDMPIGQPYVNRRRGIDRYAEIVRHGRDGPLRLGEAILVPEDQRCDPEPGVHFGPGAFLAIDQPDRAIERVLREFGLPLTFPFLLRAPDSG